MQRTNQRFDKHKRILRFLATGGSAALVEYASFIVLHSLGLHILIANSLSFMCGLVVSFGLNKFWVFRSSAEITSQFGKYLLLAVINLAISDSLIWIAVNKLSIHTLVAKLITMVLVAAWNYVIYSKLIFKHQLPATN